MARTPAVVRRATPDDLTQGAATLASAFATDPVFEWLVPQPETEAKANIVFTGSLATEFGKDHHIVDIEDEGRAVALWHDVDDWKSEDSNLREALPQLWRLFGWRMVRAIRLVSMMEAAHPTDPHRYLAFIGVHRDHQGKGLGGALLSSMLDECDEQGLPAYLESSNPVNDALYHRFGFETTGQVPLPKGAPPVNAMWRMPR